MHQPQRLAADVAYEHREYPEEHQPNRYQEQHRRYQQRLVDVLLAEQAARDKLAPSLKLPEQDTADHQEAYVYVEPLHHRYGRRSRGPEPVADQTGASAENSRHHEYYETE